MSLVAGAQSDNLGTVREVLKVLEESLQTFSFVDLARGDASVVVGGNLGRARAAATAGPAGRRRRGRAVSTRTRL